jgi:glutamate decarboxylase
VIGTPSFRCVANRIDSLFHNNDNEEVYDLADLTPQCGRKADSLKMFLGWTYYGREGYARKLEHGYDMANYLFDILERRTDFVLVSRRPLPALQVCFHWARDGKVSANEEDVTQASSRIAKSLIPKGFMVDFAPGENGMYFRIVVNKDTRQDTLDGLVEAIETTAQDLGL